MAIYSSDPITEEDLTLLYELHYKYHMLKTKPFEGHYKRQENMIRKIEEKAFSLTDKIITGLLNTYRKWLSQHALTNPDTWAEARINDSEDADDYNDAIYEFSKYYANGSYSSDVTYGNKAEKTKNFLLKTMLEMVGNKSTILDNWAELYKEDERQRIKEDYEMDEDEEDYEEKLLYKDTLLYAINNYGISEAMTMVMNYNRDFLKDIYQYAVFPVWYEYWKAKGIDKTRKQLEGVYKNLLNAQNVNDIEKRFYTINLTIEAAHQTGDMLDYIEQEHYEINRELLNNLTKKNPIEWNQELKSMGVMV